MMGRRERVRLVLLGDSLGIVFAEPEGLRLLAVAAGEEPETAHGAARRLPDEIECKIRDALRGTGGEVSCFITVGPVAIRMRRLHGEQGSAIALFVRRLAQRDPLRSAATHYSLSNREVDVLRLVLEGMSGAEISALLCISEGTVKDYFEHLLRKTTAKNRSEMIAKVLDYLPHEASPPGCPKAAQGCPMPGLCPFVEVVTRSHSQALPRPSRADASVR